MKYKKAKTPSVAASKTIITADNAGIFFGDFGCIGCASMRDWLKIVDCSIYRFNYNLNAMFDFVLRNAKIVKAESIVEADLGVSDGQISKIGRIAEDGEQEKNCNGLFVLPGLIDMHVHFRDPGFTHKEDFHTGSCAAASGGVTTVIDMPNTDPPTLTLEALEQKREIAREKSIVNFGFYMGLSGNNLDEIKKAENIAGVKIFMGSTTSGLLMQDEKIIEQLFLLGKFVMVHAEDEAIIQEHAKIYKDSQDPGVHSLIRPASAAYEASKKILHLAKKYDARVHITHVSTKEEVDELRKFAGPKITADCTPHHLYLTQSSYAELGNFVKVNPPLRTQKDSRALLKALREGVIQAVASDHAPHTKEEKQKPYQDAPSGVPGLSTMLPLLLDSVNHGELSLEAVAQFTSANPARILGIKNKGEIRKGFDADLVVVDMNKEQTVGVNGYFSKCGWSPYDGRKLKGWPIMTMVNGKIVYENGELNGINKGKEITLE